MFRASRWADAFLAASGKDAKDVLSCLKVLSEPVKSTRGFFYGHDAAAKLEKHLRETVSTLQNAEIPGGMEYAIRFLCLLVEKNCFQYIDVLLKLIEKNIDEQNGILYVTVQAAVKPDNAFEKELSESIKKKTGAVGIKMEIQVKPELLGGYILRMGGFYIDASLKGQLEKMTAELVYG